MKKYLNLYLFHIICGAIFGLIWASGILGFFDTRNTRNSVHWEPVTKEEYREGFIRDPLIGCGIGFVFATVTCVRAARNKKSG